VDNGDGTFTCAHNGDAGGNCGQNQGGGSGGNDSGFGNKGDVCNASPPPTDVCPNIDGVQTTIPAGLIKDANGNCVTPPPTDVCPNIDGVQTTIPGGLVKDANGNCVTPPPADVCPNIPGVQTSVPAGMTKDANGNCVAPNDVCPNIDGVQTSIPDGMIKDANGNCVTPNDVCPNIAGVQTSVPSGLIKDANGNCVTPPTDVCPNIEGAQTTVPGGLVKDANGNCVTPSTPPSNPPSGPTDLCPNIAGVQETVPVGTVKVAGGDCVEAAGVAPMADLALTKTVTPGSVPVNGTLTYTLRVTNNGPNTATNVTVTDDVPGGTTFVSVTPSQGTCTGTTTIKCVIGSIAVGGSAQIVLVVTGRTVGTVTNSAFVAGNEADANPANNRASVAAAVTTAPFRPVVVKRCTSLIISPKVVRVGKTSRVAVRLAISGKPFARARVVFAGAGASGSVRTNAAGRASLPLKPTRPGLIHVRTPGSPRCAGLIGASRGPSESVLTG